MCRFLYGILFSIFCRDCMSSASLRNYKLNKQGLFLYAKKLSMLLVIVVINTQCCRGIKRSICHFRNRQSASFKTSWS